MLHPPPEGHEEARHPPGSLQGPDGGSHFAAAVPDQGGFRSEDGKQPLKIPAGTGLEEPGHQLFAVRTGDRKRGCRSARCRRARRRIWRQLTGLLSTIRAISAWSYSKTSLSKNTARSSGERFSNSTKNAIDSESASSLCCSGSAGTCPSGSGSHGPTYRSRRTRAERKWSILRRVTMAARCCR